MKQQARAHFHRNIADQIGGIPINEEEAGLITMKLITKKDACEALIDIWDDLTKPQIEDERGFA